MDTTSDPGMIWACSRRFKPNVVRRDGTKLNWFRELSGIVLRDLLKAPDDQSLETACKQTLLPTRERVHQTRRASGSVASKQKR